MASFGEELRRQRELRAVSLREISDATKINIRFLEALEQNDFKHLPGGQFNKGFIRAYARHIGVSEDDMVSAYLQESKSPDDGSRSSGRVAAPGAPRTVSLRMIVAALLAVSALCAMAAITWTIVRSERTIQPQATGVRPATDRSVEPPAQAPQQAPPSGQAQSPPAGDAEGTASGMQTPAPIHDGDGTAEPSPAAQGADTERSRANPLVPGTTAPPEVPLSGGPSAPAVKIEGMQPVTAPAPLPDGPGAERRGEPRAALRPGGSLLLRVIPFHPIRFDLLCNGKPLHTGVLAVGVPLQFDCQGVYEVSLEDAGAVSLSVNGERVYLGRPGQALAGRHISAANFRDFMNAPSEAIPQ